MSADDEGYVHRPDGVDAESDAGTGGDGFGFRGWVLIAVLVVCLLVVPGIIYVRPGILSAVGIPYIASLLVLPLLPAAALGLTAVWAMTAAGRTDDEG
ncbi:MAG: hypothetical protein ABEI27_10630 [Halobellus sp.]|uniref:hypothetical protein n=1 Tax=Halobellus sp. TaxID=1979212 RepID=UPI0035D44973